MRQLGNAPDCEERPPVMKGDIIMSALDQLTDEEIY